MVTRRLQKKVSRNSHFSRPAEIDPYVWSHICLNGLEFEIHERIFEAIYFQKVVQSDNDLFSHYRTIYGFDECQFKCQDIAFFKKKRRKSWTVWV